MSIGRSARPNAPIAISILMSAPRSTKRDGPHAIIRELEWTAQLQGVDRPIVQTIFFGGGTPSLMSGKAAGSVLDAIARLWRTANDIEVTLEANPASADASRFAAYRAAGVNRLSLGVQALNDADLKFLGPVAQCRRSRCSACDRHEQFRARLARPDLCAAETDARTVAKRIAGSLVVRNRAPFALSAHHRTGHALRAARAKWRPENSRRRRCGGAL